MREDRTLKYIAIAMEFAMTALCVYLYVPQVHTAVNTAAREVRWRVRPAVRNVLRLGAPGWYRELHENHAAELATE